MESRGVTSDGFDLNGMTGWSEAGVSGGFPPLQHHMMGGANMYSGASRPMDGIQNSYAQSQARMSNAQVHQAGVGHHVPMTGGTGEQMRGMTPSMQDQLRGLMKAAGQQDQLRGLTPLQQQQLLQQYLQLQQHNMATNRVAASYDAQRMAQPRGYTYGNGMPQSSYQQQQQPAPSAMYSQRVPSTYPIGTTAGMVQQQQMYAQQQQATMINGFQGQNTVRPGYSTIQQRAPVRPVNQLQSEALLAMQRQHQLSGPRPQLQGTQGSSQNSVQEQLIALARYGKLTPEVLDALTRGNLNAIQSASMAQPMAVSAPQGFGGTGGGQLLSNGLASFQQQQIGQDARSLLADKIKLQQQAMLGGERYASVQGVIGGQEYQNSDKPSNPIQTLQDIGKTLFHLGITVEAAVNAGLLGGLSASDVRIVAEAHRKQLEAKAAMLQTQSQFLNTSQQAQSTNATLMSEHTLKSSIPDSQQLTGNMSAPIPSSPTGSIGAYSTASLPVNLHQKQSPRSQAVSAAEEDGDPLLDQLVSEDSGTKEMKKPIDEEWVKAKAEANSHEFDASQYGFFEETGLIGADVLQGLEGDSHSGSLEDPSKNLTNPTSDEDKIVESAASGPLQNVTTRTDEQDKLSTYLASLKLGTGF